MTAKDRAALHVWMTGRAHSALEAFASENGTSTSGMIEALGQHLADKLDAAASPDVDDLPDDLFPAPRQLIKSARKVDAVRRNRSGL